MKKMFILLTFLLCTSTIYAQQEILAAWTFDAIGSADSTNLTSKVLLSNTDIGLQQGTAKIYADGTHGSSDFININPSPQWTSFTGTNINDPRPTAITGRALAIANQTANGKSIVFQLSTLGYQNMIVSFAARRTATGFNSHLWEYSLDGNSYSTITTDNISSISTSAYEAHSVDFSSTNAINNQNTVYLRLTVSGASSASGNNRIDNLVFRAVPAGPDIYPPYLQSYNIINNTSILLVFNEQLNPTIATAVSNYTINNGVNVTNASLANGREVTLTVAGMVEGNNYSMTIQNIVDLAGNIMIPYAFDFTFGISSQYWAANVTELRTKWTEPLNPATNTSGTTEFKFTGEAIITAINDSYRNQIFIQDENAAIVIDDQNGLIRNQVAQGDKVTSIYGTLADYYGQLQFVVTKTNVTVIAPYQSVEPKEVTLSQLHDINYMNTIQSQLIVIRSVTFDNSYSGQNFANNAYYKLHQSSASLDSAIWIHFWNVTGLTGSTIPTSSTKDIVGVNKITRSNYRIIPRSGTDIKEPVLVNEALTNSAIIYPNPASSVFKIKTNAAAQISIYSINGQLIYSNQTSSGTLQINSSDYKSGIYIVKILYEDGTSVARKLIIK